jgi:hypothetical protein
MKRIPHSGKQFPGFRPALFFIFLLCFPFNTVLADTEICINADRQFNYAEKCFSEEEYQNAADEYRQFVFFFPNDERVELARYKTCLSLYYSGSYREAIKHCSRFEKRSDDTLFSQKAPFLISRSYLQLGMNGSAAISLNNLIMRTKDQTIKDLAAYELGWISLENLSYTEKYSDNIQKAHIYFERISPHGKKELKVEDLLSALGNYQNIPKKNPYLAGGLSIIPGAGQFYCERYQDSAVAFLLNAALGIAAYESFYNENYALGGLISFVGLGFYAGNIYGAVSGAHKYNRESNRSFLKELKGKIKINISDWIEKDRFSLSYQYNF